MAERPAPAVRRATTDDVEALVELRATMFAAMGTRTDGPWRDAAAGWFRAHLDDPDVALVLVEVEGSVAGCAVGLIRDGIPSPAVEDGTDLAINTVCTYPWARGRGCARAATRSLLDWGRQRGVARAELMATADGRSLYESLGFRETAWPAMRLVL